MLPNNFSLLLINFFSRAESTSPFRRTLRSVIFAKKSLTRRIKKIHDAEAFRAQTASTAILLSAVLVLYFSRFIRGKLAVTLAPTERVCPRTTRTTCAANFFALPRTRPSATPSSPLGASNSHNCLPRLSSYRRSRISSQQTLVFQLECLT